MFYLSWNDSQFFHYITIFIWICIFSYLIGSINIAIIIGKKFNKDPRNYFSCNAGATNIARLFSYKLGFLIFFIDVFKIALIILFAFLFKLFMFNLLKNTNSDWKIGKDNLYVIYTAGFIGVLGHCFPIYYSFKGGKGVSSFLGFILMYNFWFFILIFFLFLFLFFIYKKISLVSIFILFIIIFFIFLDVKFEILKMLCPFIDKYSCWFIKNQISGFNNIENTNYFIFSHKLFHFQKYYVQYLCLFLCIIILIKHFSNIKRLFKNNEFSWNKQ